MKDTPASTAVSGPHKRKHWQQSLQQRIIVSYALLFLLVLALLATQLGLTVYRSLISQAEHGLEVENFLAANAFEDPRSEYAQDFAVTQQWRSELESAEKEADDDEEHSSKTTVKDPPASTTQEALIRLQRSALSLAKHANARVTILTARGRAVADSDYPPITIPDQSGQIEVQAALAGKEEHAIRIDSETGERTLYTAAVIRQDGTVLGVVRLAQPMRQVLTPVRQLLGQLAATTALAMLLVTAVGIWNGRRMLRPVEELKEAAMAIANGDLQRQAPIAYDDEVGALAKAFNQMVTHLRTMIEQQRNFVANASHELRTPIFNIKLRSEALLTMDESEKAQAERFLYEIDSEADRLGRMANSLLNLARLEANHSQDDTGLEPTQIAPTLLLVAQSMRMRMRKSGLTFMAHIPEQLPLINADDADIETLVLNLLDNAIKYTPPGGTIHFVVASDEQHCTITCSDNGPGIPAEDIPHIFDRFYRVDKSRSRRRGQEGLGSGAGLGLSIVKALVERNHGKITVRSEIGNGTSFTVYLPIASLQPGNSAPNLEQSTETPAISP